MQTPPTTLRYPSLEQLQACLERRGGYSDRLDTGRTFGNIIAGHFSGRRQLAQPETAKQVTLVLAAELALEGSLETIHTLPFALAVVPVVIDLHACSELGDRM